MPFDDDHFDLLSRKAIARGLSVISFGSSKGADIRLRAQTPHETGQSLSIENHLTDTVVTLTIGLSGAHYANTGLILIASLHALALDLEQGRQALAELKEVEGRGDICSISFAEHDTLMINESYNAGPASMAAALHDFAKRPQKAKTIILTDMLELGEHSDEAHLALVPLIIKAAPQTIVLVGAAMAKIIDALPDDSTIIHSQDAATLAPELEKHVQHSDLILVKGSHGSGAAMLARALLTLPEKSLTKGAHHVS